jgi:alpha-L-fucosidase
VYKKILPAPLLILTAIAVTLPTVSRAQDPASSRAQNPASSRYGLKTVSTMAAYKSGYAHDPQQQIVYLPDMIPGIKLDIRYATANNLMRRPMYKTPAAFLRLPAAKALLAVEQDLQPLGYGLKIYDGYRPYRVTVAFYEAYHDTDFVASPYTGSRHNRGCAVDLTLIDLKTGKELFMPTPYDAFTKQASATWTDGLSEEALRNRKILQDVMLKHGFVIYPAEWWHFDFAGWQHYPVTDITFEDLLHAQPPQTAVPQTTGSSTGPRPGSPAPGSALRYTADWQSLRSYAIPDWFRDAKFGIFIHWGVYSVPEFGSEWYPRNMYQPHAGDSNDAKVFTHHIATYGPQDRFGYKDLIPLFRAQYFDADRWAGLFKRAGAKYVVPVAEHHDGFAMYKTSLSRWNAAEMGPKRDIIGELSAAVRRKGLIFGLSSHRIEHWWFMNGGRTFNSDVNDEVYKDFYGPAMQETDSMTPEYMNDWLLRCTELTDKYHPQLFWFDWWIGVQPRFQPYLKSFASYYYNQGLQWNKGVVINYKYNSFPPGVAVLDLERGMLNGIRDTAWQTDDAVGFQSWGYIKGENYKSPQYLIDELVDIVSKNGNLLLNIGPRSDGTIPIEQQQLLLSMGAWLSVNGEAIYGSRPWKEYGEGPTENASGPFADSKIKPFTADDIRYTTKKDTLYAITLKLPDGDTRMQKLGSDAGNGRIGSVKLVGSTEKIRWTQEKDALLIHPATHYPSRYAAVYEIRFARNTDQ